MVLDSYAIKRGKRLRRGYTTGTCAAAAAQAAVEMLLTGAAVHAVSLTTPDGTRLILEPEAIRTEPDSVSCAVRKDAGDDPDITDGLLIFASVKKTPSGITICGGEGVGVVTKAGLACAVGEAAINPVPRRMIREGAAQIAARCGYGGGLQITIAIPGGAAVAKKTFNPRLGIEGGLSILGTTGIVDPMSEKALVDTIRTEMNARRAAGERHCLAFFGNYGVDFSRHELGLDVTGRITCSNYVGELLDYAVYCGFADVLLIGHLGKVIKLAQGIMNTHSRYGDGRMTFLALAAVFAGADAQTAREIYAALTTDEAVRILRVHGLLPAVMVQAMEKIEQYLSARVQGEIPVAAIAFSNEYGVLGKTVGADALLACHRRR